MATYIRPVGRLGGHYNTGSFDLVVKANTTITQGDFVSVDSTGYAIPSTSGRIWGVAAGTVVQGATATLTVKVTVDPMNVYLVPVSGTALTQASVGEYFTLTGGTGAQQITSSSASSTTGQVYCINYTGGVDPVRSNAGYAQVVIAQSPFAIS